MSLRNVLLVSALAGCCLAQRGSYAGRRPIGYPAFTTPTTLAPLGNRFGEDVTTTTVRLPIEALGDRELVERLSKLPIDKQPFWLVNWQALENNRNNPQSFQPNPNSFVDPYPSQNGQQTAQVQNIQTPAIASSTNFRGAGDFLQRSGDINAGNRVVANGQLIDSTAQSSSGNPKFGRFQGTNRPLSNLQVSSADIRPKSF